MATQAKEEYHLDEIWLIPAGHSPNKDEFAMTPFQTRLLLCQIASLAYDWLKTDSIEIDSDKTSYTYRTLEKLQEKYQNENHEFFFLMGADSLHYFDKWVKPERICELATILVINRDAFKEQELSQKISQIKQLFPARIYPVHCSKFDVSSSLIREWFASSDSKLRKRCRQVLPEEVYRRILSEHLYQK